MSASADARVSVLVHRLREIVGTEHVLDAEDLMASYTTDWSGRFNGAALAVVRPASTEQVAEVVRACIEAGVPMVPQGGNTGLVWGSVPGPGPAPVLISLRRLDGIAPVDELAGQVTVGAGATLGDVHRHVEQAGWRYGVDLAARDSATIGGTVATNAGGIHVIAYGMTRAQVAGIEAVLPDGSVVSHLGGLAKDNTGYDLASLLCGSEGTLGIITAVRLRLHRPTPGTVVGLFGTADYAGAIALMSAAVAGPAQVIAAEVIDEPGIERVRAVSGLPWPLAQPAPVLALLELVADDAALEALAAHPAVVGEPTIAIDAADRARLWEYRERQSEAYSALGVVHKLDVSVPLASLAACAEELHTVVRAFPEVTTFGVFGHLADGNIHLEIAGPDPDDLAVDLAVLECVARFGGSISAEHGIGRVKARELRLCRSVEEIAAMRAIKDALDPRCLMNPGVIFA